MSSTHWTKFVIYLSSPATVTVQPKQFDHCLCVTIIHIYSFFSSIHLFFFFACCTSRKHEQVIYLIHSICLSNQHRFIEYSEQQSFIGSAIYIYIPEYFVIHTTYVQIQWNIVLFHRHSEWYFTKPKTNHIDLGDSCILIFDCFFVMLCDNEWSSMLLAGIRAWLVGREKRNYLTQT